MGTYESIRIDPALIPKIEARVLCATFLEAVLQFYEDPANAAGFERWLNGREGGIADGTGNSSAITGGIPQPYAPAGGVATAGRVSTTVGSIDSRKA